MSKLEELREELKHIDANLAAGERFEEQGYDCEGMMCITRSIRASVARQIKELEDAVAL